MAVDPAVLDWMLDSDPALRWQVERDIAGEPPEVWEATRARIATEGFGARLLALQDPDGQWAGGAYFPQDFDFDGPEAAEDAGQPWTATTWSLNALRDWGLDAAALAGTAELLAVNSRWEYDDLPYWGGEVDCCINAFTLANGVWLGADVAGIAQWFLDHQMADGGWNCEWVEGSTRSSFHSTINVLKGLLYYEAATGGSRRAACRPAHRRGVSAEAPAAPHPVHRRARGTMGGPVRVPVPLRSTARSTPWTTSGRLHCTTAAGRTRVWPTAIEVIRSARESGRDLAAGAALPGRVWFEVDVPPGEPSKWLTFQGTRVLDWWDRAVPGSAVWGA